MKLLLLDVDGVVLNKSEYFSVRYARDFGVDPDLVASFFKGPLVSCQKGDADLKIELEPYLDKWGYQDGVDAFVQYWFESDYSVNHEASSLLEKFKEAGVKIYLASNNEKYRASYLLDRFKELAFIDGAYFSCDLKVRKEDPNFFEHIINDTGLDPAEIYYTDNDQKNVDSAKSVGINAYLYTDETLEGFLSKI